MEYAKSIDQDIFNILKDSVTESDKEYDDTIDLNHFVGWNTVTEWSPLPKMVFTKRTIKRTNYAFLFIFR